MVGEGHREQRVEQGGTTRNTVSVSAAIAAANAGLPATPGTAVRFPGEDGGRSLAEMALRDLDAALQLLADRAQYITGANGAAIALRRDGKKDMLCRASTGSNVPELGALLSTEFGLSGESVRTRQALRCDDAERDARVNREVCREMGIASVVVMPVVNDDEVLGVFELFSGRVNAFGERDLSALQRLSEMVETAIRLAHATEGLTERLKTADGSAAKEAAGTEDEDGILEALEPEVAAEPSAVQETLLEETASGATAQEIESKAAAPEAPREVAAPARVLPEPAIPVPPVVEQTSQPAPRIQKAVPPGSEAVAPPKKKLFWSAALDVSSDARKAGEGDDSHVPPVLRNLRKCHACGFPVSEGRMLCVECEEKKWRGQLRGKPAAQPQPAAKTVLDESSSAPVARLMAAAQGTPTTTSETPGSELAPTSKASTGASMSPGRPVQEEKKSEQTAASATGTPSSEPVGTPLVATAESPRSAAPEFVLSAGLEPSRSWFSANKYILGAILIVAAVVAAILLLR